MISKVRPVVKDTGDNSDWFQTWFDSPYYHVFHKDRDGKEAETFLEKLICVERNIQYSVLNIQSQLIGLIECMDHVFCVITES